jgi:hypothetical protein
MASTVGGWRRQKRAEFRAFQQAYRTLNFGSAWTPLDTSVVSQWIRDAREKLKGNWNPIACEKAKTRRRRKRMSKSSKELAARIVARIRRAVK